MNNATEKTESLAAIKKRVRERCDEERAQIETDLAGSQDRDVYVDVSRYGREWYLTYEIARPPYGKTLLVQGCRGRSRTAVLRDMSMTLAQIDSLRPWRVYVRQAEFGLPRGEGADRSEYTLYRVALGVGITPRGEIVATGQLNVA